LKHAVFWDVEMLRRAPLLRTNVSEERIISIIINKMLLVTGNVVPSSLILTTLMMEAIRSSKTSVLARATQRHIPEDGLPQNICSLQTSDTGMRRVWQRRLSAAVFPGALNCAKPSCGVLMIVLCIQCPCMSFTVLYARFFTCSSTVKGEAAMKGPETDF
jgi:hypothetical protein